MYSEKNKSKTNYVYYYNIMSGKSGSESRLNLETIKVEIDSDKKTMKVTIEVGNVSITRHYQKSAKEYWFNSTYQELADRLPHYLTKAKEFERSLQENGINARCEGWRYYSENSVSFYVNNIPQAKYIVFLQAYRTYLVEAVIAMCPIRAKFLVIDLALRLNLRLESIFSPQDLVFDALMAQAEQDNYKESTRWALINYYDHYAVKTNVANAQANDLTNPLSVAPKSLYDQYARYAGDRFSDYAKDAQTKMAKLLMSIPSPDVFQLGQVAYEKKMLACALQGSDQPFATDLLNNIINNHQQTIAANVTVEAVCELVEKIKELNRQRPQQNAQPISANQATFFQPVTRFEPMDVERVNEHRADTGKLSSSSSSVSSSPLGLFSAAPTPVKPVKIPKAYECPITHELMNDPVILSLDDYTYERASITGWLRENRNSPMNRQIMNAGDTIEMVLRPNRALAEAIDEFKDDNPGLAVTTHQLAL